MLLSSPWIIAILITITITLIILFTKSNAQTLLRHKKLPSWLLKRLPQVLCDRIHRGQLLTWDTASDIFELYIMPASYFVLLSLGLYSANYFLLPRLPSLQNRNPSSLSCPRSRFFCLTLNNMTLSFPLETQEWMLYFYAILLPSSWCLVHFADPGVIPRQCARRTLDVYPYDEVLYARDKLCKTCHVVKRARSKHCRMCDRCVVRFDHYCGWVACCLGIYNTRYFLLFLVVHAVAMFHGGIVAIQIVMESMGEIIEKGFVFVRTGEAVRRFSWRVAFAVEGDVILLGFVLLAVGCLVLGFFAWHLYLVCVNMTTNESYKWESIIEGCKSYEEKHGISLMEAWAEEAKDDPDDFVPEFGVDGLPIRIYHRGLVENIKEVLWPRSFVKGRNER